jgi:hypothetical protein
MITTITVQKEVEIKFVKVALAVRYDEEDMPNDFPLRSGDMWNATIEIDTGKILDWPAGKSGEFYMKVCDCGNYYLLDENKAVVASIEEDYVPNGVIPGEYGDYAEFKINESGIVKNWPKSPRLDAFFPE